MPWQTQVAVVLHAGNTIITPNGLFVYNGAPALGNLPLFYVASANTFTDPVGNSLAGGVVIGQQSSAHWHWDYTTGNLDVVDTGGNTIFTVKSVDGLKSFASPNVWAQLFQGALNVQGGTGQFAPGTFSASSNPGEVAISSGKVTSLDNPSNLIVDSSSASGIGSSFISLQADRVSLNTTATSNIPDTSVNPGHQSAAPAAYNQSYEQASTNRINQIMDILAAVGIWPF